MTAHTAQPTAAIVIIGNEILSGRTKDANLPWLGEQLAAMGIRLTEARVIPDITLVIVDTVNTLRAANDYVFTTGGIGPTHDDITSASIAKAFGTTIHRHPDAEAALLAYYDPKKVNDARMKMAEVPLGAVLVANPVSIAPGFRMENVYVFAGVPDIMQAMFDNIRHELRNGAPIQSRSVTTFLLEGDVAEELSRIQERAPGIDIGSYPMIKDQRLGTSLVLRGSDEAELERAFTEVKAMIAAMKGEIIREESGD